MAHFFSCGFGGFGASAAFVASAVLLAATGFSLAAILVVAGAADFAAGIVGIADIGAVIRSDEDLAIGRYIHAPMVAIGDYGTPGYGPGA